MISVQHISKTFKLYRKPSERLKEIIFRQCRHKRFDAVKDLSFTVPGGQTLGIIGKNGAGKSTVLKLLTGVLIPDSGTIHISGKITGLLELGTGFNHEFSGIDNIIHNATYLGLSKAEINRKMGEIIAFTELGEFIHEPLKTYSSGMIMRLAFSVAIHAEPQVFVVDEALSVGDVYFQQKCMEKIRAFKAGGGAIVFVSHDMNAVKVLCDEAILLDCGTAIAYGEPEAIINAYNRHIARRSRPGDGQREGRSRNGYGSREVVIESVTLKDAHQNETQILVSGEPAEIVITMTGQAVMANLTLGIAIRDRFGQNIYGTNSHYLKKKIDVQPGQTVEIVYSFGQFNLGPGKYSITAAIHSGRSHVDQCVHWVDACVVFETVLGNEPFFTGLIRLTPDLKIKGD